MPGILEFSSDPSDILSAPDANLLGLSKALGVGVGRGLVGWAGVPGDIAGKFPERWRDKDRLPTPKDIESYIEAYTGQFYQPQNIWEERARMLGERVPDAFASLGLGRVLKKAQRAAKQWSREQPPIKRGILGD